MRLRRIARSFGCPAARCPVVAAIDGTLRADDDGKPASAKSVQSYSG